MIDGILLLCIADGSNLTPRFAAIAAVSGVTADPWRSGSLLRRNLQDKAHGRGNWLSYMALLLRSCPVVGRRPTSSRRRWLAVVAHDGGGGASCAGSGSSGRRSGQQTAQGAAWAAKRPAKHPGRSQRWCVRGDGSDNQR